MNLNSRLLKLESRFARPSRSPVVWAAIVEGNLIRLGLADGTNLTGSEARQALEEAQKRRDPYKVYLFDPDELFHPCHSNAV
jgi:hypothetical protein